MSSKPIVLVSSEGEKFTTDESVAVQCKTIHHLIEDGCADSDIPVHNVTGKILSKVIEYCEKHAKSPNNTDDDQTDEELKAFDAGFYDFVNDQKTAFDIMLAANYLDNKSLLELGCKKVAESVKGLTTRDIRKLYRIRNDFTPEEEAKVQEENAWSFD
uniref:SKP1-like protein 13 n=1 Tax=Erigeron canadensis TaxID=72917 RepID=UPI001CB968BF|nr:SKP1-like protein 13 [Erigeron canadensis]